MTTAPAKPSTLCPAPGKMTKVDLVGLVFSHLTVRRYIGKCPATGKALWECECECGEFVTKRRDRILDGLVKSCGCRRNDHVTVHGLLHTPEYKVWATMNQRCVNPNNGKYERYGGRGITVCDRWKHSYANFYSDMGPRPTPKHSIERKDNDGNYEPGNCRWATPIEQANNTSRSRFITIGGRTQSLAQWLREKHSYAGTFHKRLGKGWSEEKAICEPLIRKGKNRPAHAN